MQKLALKTPNPEKVEFARSKDANEVAQHEPPHLGLYSLNFQYDLAFESLKTKILSTACLAL